MFKHLRHSQSCPGCLHGSFHTHILGLLRNRASPAPRRRQGHHADDGLIVDETPCVGTACEASGVGGDALCPSSFCRAGVPLALLDRT